MKRVLCLMLIVAAGSTVAAQSSLPIELSKLQGSWRATSVSGQPVPAGVTVDFIVAGNTYKSVTNGQIDETGTIVLDPKPTPWALDLRIETGKDGGKRQLGRVEVKDDTMTLNLADVGDTTRPDTTAAIMIVLKKSRDLHPLR